MKKSLVLVLVLMLVFVTGCVEYEAEIKPETLNLANNGRGVVTINVTTEDPENLESIFDIQMSYDGYYLESLRWNIEDDVLSAKIDRRELREMLIEKGVAEEVFEEMVTFTILIRYGEQQNTVEVYTIRVINPNNAPEK